jgi:hypothetical protein
MSQEANVFDVISNPLFADKPSVLRLNKALDIEPSVFETKASIPNAAILETMRADTDWVKHLDVNNPDKAIDALLSKRSLGDGTQVVLMYLEGMDFSNKELLQEYLQALQSTIETPKLAEHSRPTIVITESERISGIPSLSEMSTMAKSIFGNKGILLLDASISASSKVFNSALAGGFKFWNKKECAIYLSIPGGLGSALNYANALTGQEIVTFPEM